MFASENILLNSVICALEIAMPNPKEKDSKSCKWAPRDIIFTDRALYIFAEVPVVSDKKDFQGIPTANYLQSVYERVEVKLFKAEGPIINEKSLSYLADLPQFFRNFNFIVELVVKESQRRRIIACDSKRSAEDFVKIFNLISAYRCYLFQERADLDGHSYINKWVRDYNQHNGEMWFDADILDSTHLLDLQKFVSQNDGINSLIFSGEALHFSQGEEAITTASDVIISVTGANFKKLSFIDNGMKNQHLSTLQHIIGSKPQLEYLELSGQHLTGDSLDIFCSIFKENRFIQKLILTNNQLGVGSNIKEKMTFFMQSFFNDLNGAIVLDMSYNMIDDECLFPLIKYLFANHHAQSLAMVNLEWNNFTNKGKRTIVVGYSKCYNKKLQCKFGPLPLTYATLKQAVAVSSTSRERSNTTRQSGFSKTVSTVMTEVSVPDTTVEITIRRKPANPELGMKYLPLHFQLREEIQNFRQQIDKMIKSRSEICVEDIQQLMYEITNSEVEFPRQLLEPLFILTNELIQKAIDTENIFTLEILMDVLCMMNARNIPAEIKYKALAEEAQTIATNLIKAINMDLTCGNDDALVKLLVENLARAKQIGMRGEVIDIAITLKALCTKLLQEMVSQAPRDDEETSIEAQMYILREEDKRSVYDSKYDQYISAKSLDGFNLQLVVDLEPDLALHPYNTDYIKITALNLNYARKNMTESRKILYEDEIYPLINAHTRAAFILSDGQPDSGKNLHFSNIRNDMMLRYARLLFRYRLNLDELFGACQEPPVHEVQHPKFEEIAEESLESFSNISDKNHLIYSESALSRPLTKILSSETAKAIKMNKDLIFIQQISKDTETQYKLIRTWFETFIINKTIVLSQEFSDEIYVQVYRQLNFKRSLNTPAAVKEKTKTVMIIVVLLTHYVTPSPKLMQILLYWLEQLSHDKLTERMALLALKGLRQPRIHEQTGRAYYDWPPSLYEIDAVAREKCPTQVTIEWPDGTLKQFQVDETTTIESLLKTHIYTNPYFEREPEQVLHWLFTCEDDINKFPKPISREKKILKLMYKDEKEQEAQLKQAESIINKMKEARSKNRRQSLMLTKSKSRESKTEAETEFKMFTLLLRRRIYPSLFHAPCFNFKSLSSAQKNFIFHQGRLDYVERDILQLPILTKENAVILAALVFKIKYQTKILRSKENTLTADIFKNNLDYAIPNSMLITQKAQQWEDQIVKCFEQQNMNEMSTSEAEDQFLLLLASYEFMFASYFVISRKPTREGFRLQDLNVQFIGKRSIPNTKRPTTKVVKKRSRFQDSESDDSSNDDSKDKSATPSEDSEDQGSEDEVVLSEENKIGLNVFEEYFQSQKTDILLVCTHSHLLFVENRKRDKVLLKLKYEDLLYLMGKQDELKIGMILKKKMGVNNDTFDCRTEFLVDGGGARAIAEDILTYCQIYLLEHQLNNHDYCDIIKRNVIDGLFENELQTAEKGKGYDIIIDDDILLGNVNLASTQTKLGKKVVDEMPNTSYENIGAENDNDDAVSEMRQGTFRAQSPFEKHEAKISKQLGLKIKLKQPNFVIYMRKHPLYTMSGSEQHSRYLKGDKKLVEYTKRITQKFNPTTIEEISSDEQSSSSQQDTSNEIVSSRPKTLTTFPTAPAPRAGPPRAPPPRAPAPQRPASPKLSIAEPVQPPQVIPRAPAPRPRVPPPVQIVNEPKVIQQSTPAEVVMDKPVLQAVPVQAVLPVIVIPQQETVIAQPAQPIEPVKQPESQINSNAFMAAYRQQTLEEKPKADVKVETAPKVRPSGIKFEKMNASDKKAQLGKVMGAFGPPP